MTTVYFVRHAQPDYSTGNDDYSFDLSEEGMLDRLEARRALEKVKIDSAYCSPYRRSLSTIEPILKEHNIKVVIDKRLREREHGIGSNNQDMFRKRWSDHDFHEPGGESIGMVQKRNIDALEQIIRSNSERTVLVGTHGTALCSMINYYRPEFGYDDFMRTINYMPWVVRVDFNGTQLLSLDEICYVEKEYHGVK